MNSSHPPLPDDSDLHAMVDCRLPPEDAERLRASLAPAAQEEANAWAQQRALLQTLHGDWLERPLPEVLRQAAGRLQDTHAARRRWATWGGMAAGWLLAFGLGWGLHGSWSDGATLAATASPPLLFAQQATVAHAVYQPEQRHPVEVAAAQQEHLVQWLSKRLARPLAVPHLQQQGFELVGGRLLPGGSGARAQFMYQNAAGTRITLYLGALDDAQAEAFQFYDKGAVSSFYWVERGFGYALSGEMPRPALQALATAVYRQLSAAPPMGAHAPAKGS
ncbi:anti-sigma factor family protein [Alicycliphilus denitrificans]|uniref:anti-sigma factor family protein n=1 Tax=Alicycliphilus denitrificans TaxID=179636 RepID=UPI00384B49CA